MAIDKLRSPQDTSSTPGYVSWEELNVCGERWVREVRYYLRRFDGGSNLVVIEGDKSLRHMFTRLCTIFPGRSFG
ncbi:hypothetical protein K2173_018681 [Erythroxylum novogranatense]|uniref:Uncharacterized protein n=1 Tax=Erythroxylum novogranatense TaxID=1862640 RepID=A0AAV8T3B6_9ROSI|nr:hypothetical protein K2173_018681 [Erythroxylum novogranatense]